MKLKMVSETGPLFFFPWDDTDISFDDIREILVPLSIRENSNSDTQDLYLAQYFMIFHNCDGYVLEHNRDAYRHYKWKQQEDQEERLSHVQSNTELGC